jgi:hypothetical protein
MNVDDYLKDLDADLKALIPDQLIALGHASEREIVRLQAELNAAIASHEAALKNIMDAVVKARQQQ